MLRDFNFNISRKLALPRRRADEPSGKSLLCLSDLGLWTDFIELATLASAAGSGDQDSQAHAGFLGEARSKELGHRFAQCTLHACVVEYR
jgi:hypothetical protein